MRFLLAWISLVTWQISGVAAWFFPKDQVQFQSALANLMEPDEPVVSLDVLIRQMPDSKLAERWEEAIALLGYPKLDRVLEQRTRDLLMLRIPRELQFEKFLPFLKHEDPSFSEWIQRLFMEKISREDLAGSSQRVMPPLLKDPRLQDLALAVLQAKLPPRELKTYVDMVVPLFDHGLPSSRLKALKFVQEHMQSVLRPEHIAKIVELLCDDYEEDYVRHAAAKLLHQEMGSDALLLHWAKIWPVLQDKSEDVRRTTAELLVDTGSKLPKDHVANNSELFVELVWSSEYEPRTKFWDIPGMLRGAWGEKWQSPRKAEILEVISKLASSTLAQHREHIMGWRDLRGQTWLHLAAAAGHLEACQALVDQAGFALREQNRFGEEPLALASSPAVNKFLRSRMQFQETRFGHGNAYDDMDQDERPVTELMWYTVPLPGATGHLTTGCHSFLVMIVSDTDQPEKRYVLEKAGTNATEPHQKNGVFIGSADLSKNLLRVEGVKAYAPQLSVAKGTLKKGLKMRELYQKAHDMGPYHLADLNCHHAALLVYNHSCARAEDQMTTAPNKWLAKVAHYATKLGAFNSPRFVSEVADVKSEVGSGSGAQDCKLVDTPECKVVDIPPGFKEATDVHGDKPHAAHLTAAMSYAVYQIDAVSFLTPPAAGASASVFNRLNRAVLICGAGVAKPYTVEPQQNMLIDVQNGEKAVVDIHGVGHLPGVCFSWRVLLSKQPVWTGEQYELTTNFRDEVVLNEVTPKAEAEVLHSTQKANSTSPVQWLLARRAGTVYLIFQGTVDVQDAVIDVSAVPDYGRFKEHGIGVHSGIASILEQDVDDVGHVLNDVLGALKQHRQAGELLVLCGHSLGGGYAQVMAIHLLIRDVEIFAVQTFGAPHVLVPPGKTAPQMLWQRLHALTTHWVHAWDPVPRLPLCKTWLVDVMPKLQKELGKGIRVGMGQKFIDGFQYPRVLEKYDVVGRVLLVSLALGAAYNASDAAMPLKMLLGQKPPEDIMTLDKIAAYHDMRDYLQIAQKLSDSDHR